MKLARFSIGGGGPSLGVTDGEGIASLAHLLPDAPDDMIALIDHWDQLKDSVAAITQFEYRLDQVKLHAPVRRPGKILGIGLNYADHVAEAGGEIPTDQVWFAKVTTSVAGPHDPIDLPIVSELLDYEAELVFVIGKRCRHVEPADAMQAIFGYAAGNDVSVRDWQLKTSQFILGKSFDTHAPFGPWIATPDEVDPADLEIASYVNGERRQHSRTKYLIFDCAAQIAHLSKAMTLEPGDVIFTGTPGGVGGAMKPPQWLKAGDVVRIEIENVGAIENVVVPEKRPN